MPVDQVSTRNNATGVKEPEHYFTPTAEPHGEPNTRTTLSESASRGVAALNLMVTRPDETLMASTSARSRPANGRPKALSRTPEDVRKHDSYYMSVAEAVRGSESDETPNRNGANCWGSKVGAVIVQGSGPAGERIISTGYNGTPAGFKNCLDGGCVRCSYRRTDPKAGGIGLDRCICVHAEQNALLTAARFGISVADSTIYSTLSPCFNCLKEAIQAGVVRFVYLKEYAANYDPELQKQYDDLAKRLRGRDKTNFEQLVGSPAIVDPVGQFPDGGSTEKLA